MAFVIRRDRSKQKDLIRVAYSKHRPILSLKGLMSPEKLEESSAAIIASFNVKSSTWRYEKETRMIIDLKTCSTRGSHYFVDLAPNAFEGVILGMRCDLAPPYIRKALDAKGYNQTKIWQARKSRTEFAIERVEA